GWSVSAEHSAIREDLRWALRARLSGADFFTRHVDVNFGLGGGAGDDSFHVKALVPVMRAPARQVALRHAERLLCATQGVSSLAHEEPASCASRFRRLRLPH